VCVCVYLGACDETVRVGENVLDKGDDFKIDIWYLYENDDNDHVERQVTSCNFMVLSYMKFMVSQVKVRLKELYERVSCFLSSLIALF
jgi:hypothetical protein